MRRRNDSAYVARADAHCAPLRIHAVAHCDAYSVQIINGGTRAFNKQRADHCVCEYRLTNEGIRSLHGFMGYGKALRGDNVRLTSMQCSQRVFQCTEADLIKLVTQSDVSLDDLSCGADIAKEGTPSSEWCATSMNQCSCTAPGCVLLKMDLSHIEGMGEVRLLTWRGKGNSTNLQVPKEQLAAMRMRASNTFVQ